MPPTSFLASGDAPRLIGVVPLGLRDRKERDLWYHAHGEAEAQRAAVERRFAQLGDLLATTGGDAVPRAHTLRANADLNALLRQAALEHEHRAGAASP